MEAEQKKLVLAFIRSVGYFFSDGHRITDQDCEMVYEENIELIEDLLKVNPNET